MKRIKILLLNLDSRNEAGEKLRQMLEAGCKDCFQIKHELVGEPEVSQAAKRLASILATFSPGVTFFVFGSGSRHAMADLFKVLRASKTPRPVIAVVNSGASREVAEAFYHGANDFLIPPFRAMNVLPRLWRCLEETRPEHASIRDWKEKLGLKQFIGESPVLLAEIKKIPAVARCDASVLIAGETGTGKEICARAIHYLSPRAARPFIAVNCGAIPPELVENELFGHEPGAFTSALSSSLGLVREAEGGTLFLDEIDSLPVLAQVKLLRLLQEKEFRPLGARQNCRADLRVIAATNANLEEALRAGRFRQDLYYRLNVLTLTLPSLRKRHGDIPLLSRYFVAKFTTELGKPARILSPAAMQKLALYEWPGNVRELENVIERSLVLSEQFSIRGDEIVLPQSAADPLPEKTVLPSTEVTIDRFEPNSILLDVDAKESALLVLAEAWYPGWRAEIDGKVTPMLPANVWMRAVPVPAGKHQVRVFFHQNYLATGGIISLASAGFLLMVLRRRE